MERTLATAMGTTCPASRTPEEEQTTIESELEACFALFLVLHSEKASKKKGKKMHKNRNNSLCKGGMVSKRKKEEGTKKFNL